MKKIILTTLLALASSLFASAAVITLDFEGVGNTNAVGNFYNGGAGPNYGVAFNGPTLALVDSDAGGTGNFANEPTGDTIMFFTDSNASIMSLAAGFTTGFSFFYTSSTAGSVRVYDGVNGTGALLTTLGFVDQSNGGGCVGDPNGAFCNWSAVGVAFTGTAKSVVFSGVAGQTGFDNITFGSETPGGAVPEPSTYAMIGAGLATLVAARRRS